MNNMLYSRSLVLIGTLLMPVAAFAHAGHGTSGLLAGFGHPIGGLDHLMAMIAVGLWGAQMGGRSLWVVPVTFVLVMVVGGILGISGVEVPFFETGILASLIFLGLLMAFSMTLPLIASVVLVSVFAIFHGYAHGSEMLVATSGLTYGMGFAVATALLLLVGIGAGYGLQKLHIEKLARVAGVAIAASGVYLAFA